MQLSLKLLLAMLMGVAGMSAQSAQPSADATQEPRTVTFCELAKDPAAYNRQLIRLSGFVTHGFEDFALSDPNCPATPTRFWLWLMYGGTVESGTMYCCPGEGGRDTRSDTLTVEGVKIPLLRDQVFQQFTELLKRERDTTVRVTLTGTFFAGKGEAGESLRGYGHMGCCSLFAIQRVEAFAPHTRSDLDYSAESGWYENEGCKSQSLRYARHISISSFDTEPAKQVIAEQKLADGGERAWAFTDTQRVAMESLKSLYSNETPVLREVRKSPARHVYRWKPASKTVITVVVVRPYWLSFYAKSDQVAWVSTTVKEAKCR
ncbi:MAG: hypothetical protein LAO20_06475 [Acidobacteriia bacterium]|nr:hypothetical protein [Terriglobia bacterium]